MRRTHNAALALLLLIGRSLAQCARALGGAPLYPQLYRLPPGTGRRQTQAGDRR